MGVMCDSVYIASEVLQAKNRCLQLYNAIREYKTPIVPGVDTFNERMQTRMLILRIQYFKILCSCDYFCQHMSCASFY